MFNTSVNSYRRGIRNAVLVNPKLFILEKVNLAPPTIGWKNLVKLFKNLYYLVRVITLGIYVGYESPSIIKYLEPSTGDLFTARFADCHFDEKLNPTLGGETKQ